MQVEAPVANDLQWACRQVLRKDYGPWVRQRQLELAQLLQELRQIKQFMEGMRTDQAKAACQDTNPAMIELLVQSNAWPDKALAWLPVIGVPIMGTIDDTNEQLLRFAHRTWLNS